MKIFDFNKLTETVAAYIETKIELMKLDAKDEISKVIAKSMTWGLILICTLTALIFISVGLSILLNEIIESAYLGYLIVAGVYAIAALIIFLTKDKLEDKFIKEVNGAEYLKESGEHNEE